MINPYQRVGLLTSNRLQFVVIQKVVLQGSFMYIVWQNL